MENNNNSNVILEDYPFRHEVQTRWKDMDVFGHVNNANYLTYIEDARISMFNHWAV